MLLASSARLTAQPEKPQLGRAFSLRSSTSSRFACTECHSEKRGGWGKTVTLQQQKGGKLPSHYDIPPEPALTHSEHQAPTCCFPAPEDPHRTPDPCRGKMRSCLTSPAASAARSNNCLPWVYSKAGIVKLRGVRQELKPQKCSQEHRTLLWAALVSSRCHEFKHPQKNL